jgi:hypothetical protein
VEVSEIWCKHPAAITRYIKGKVKSQLNFGNYLVNVLHMLALQDHHQVHVITKILRKLDTRWFKYDQD